MYAVYLLALLACASAAPYFPPEGPPPFHGHHRHHHHPGPHGPHGYESALSNNFRDGLFDTNNFWTSLAEEMHRLDEMLNDFSLHFPVSSSSDKIEGNSYVVNIKLEGFDEKDIIVKAREGVLMIQAVHKTEEGNERSYLDLRTLPSNVNAAGSWTFDKGDLKIVFPLNNKPDDANEGTVVPDVQENRSREEIGNTDDDISRQEADVGVRGDSGKDIEILTNMVPDDDRVEATTYAVDLKNEVEFVPVRM